MSTVKLTLLLFNGLTAHDADDNIVPGLAEKWEYDAETCTYTFHIRDGIQWHDGEKFTADDVKFTIEAIMDPENGSENAPNYEDVEEITVIDDQHRFLPPFRAERGFPGIHDDGHPAEAPAGR